MRRYAKIPFSNACLDPLSRKMKGTGSSFLLDGGLGGQNSYTSIEDYELTTGRRIDDPVEVYKPKRTKQRAPKGQGLSDKIASQLEKLNINRKPKRKNISMNI